MPKVFASLCLHVPPINTSDAVEGLQRTGKPPVPESADDPFEGRRSRIFFSEMRMRSACCAISSISASCIFFMLGTNLLYSFPLFDNDPRRDDDFELIDSESTEPGRCCCCCCCCWAIICWYSAGLAKNTGWTPSHGIWGWCIG